MEVGKSPYNIVVGLSYIAQELTIALPHYSFIHILLCSLLLLSVSSSFVCSTHDVDLLLVMSNQCHDVVHVDRIHGDTMSLLFEVVKQDVVEVDQLLKGCSVIMLDVQILISFASTGPMSLGDLE